LVGWFAGWFVTRVNPKTMWLEVNETRFIQ